MEGGYDSYRPVVSLKERPMIPRKLRTKVLDILHAAHNGTSGMEARALEMVWRPGIREDILQRRAACRTCTEAAPSQPAPPLVKPPKPCCNIAHQGGHMYIVIVDSFLNWPSVIKTGGKGGATDLAKALRRHFQDVGVPEVLTSDEDPEFIALKMQEFLRWWGVKNRTSSVYYPHANLQAEFRVTVVKIMLREKVTPTVSLECDEVS